MAYGEIKAVLNAVNFGPDIQKQIEDAFAPAKIYNVDMSDSAAIREIIQEVDVAVLPDDLDDRILEGKKLKWVHCCHAGLTKSARPEIFERGIILTGSAGRSAPSLAEHVFFFALALTYDVYRLKEAQQEHDWSRFSRQYTSSRGLNGKTMGIIGLGNTGRAVAKRAKAFDMKVVAYSRAAYDALPENTDEYYSATNGDTILPLLEQSDYLVLCCHLSDATYHIIGKNEFHKMKKSAFLINLSRGAVVVQDDLYDALKNEIIAGAGCDVFEQEPLPENNPLWNLPNIIITPHATPRVANFPQSTINFLLENVKRYRNGEDLINRLTERDMFTRM